MCICECAHIVRIACFHRCVHAQTQHFGLNLCNVYRTRTQSAIFHRSALLHDLTDNRDGPYISQNGTQFNVAVSWHYAMYFAVSNELAS